MLLGARETQTATKRAELRVRCRGICWCWRVLADVANASKEVRIGVERVGVCEVVMCNGGAFLRSYTIGRVSDGEGLIANV